ncbi:hypothetical protein GLOTRDRAFT_90798 [Gloeophyllum trabeum ATCC 11539]|uniref:Matrin-type domain-containing protein n=1 Tax=Gloeophyllum trabeum (strain ATCC 11539 / FP-39264 / Madison 617) TaxID=670483 RepID=S7QIK4_GLOTA|nr:uncharacterized protein GLOTRDRAFT_90798 [Gloeophyllum trabeum ATCC 11539]EPQ59097.1 hypothetical protein GLOTRDRAFT_90798 [Gloeophyllum trabeum ATCC 11539]
MDSVIEVQRQTHEEIERYERALYQLLSKPNPNHQQRLQTEHKASQILDRIGSRVTALDGLYQDQDTRNAEIESLSASSKHDDLSEFYSRLVKIQEHYAKYPDSVAGGFELELAAFLEEGQEVEGEDEDEEQEDPIALLFSGEEAYGKYLDLYANHNTYNNIKNVGKRLGYLQYLDILIAAQNGPIHSDLPKEVRLSRDYELTQPLVDVDTAQKEAAEDFNKKWEAGELSDWEEARSKTQPDANGSEGGQKHYAKQTVYDAHLTSKRHIKATAKQATAEAPPQNPNGTRSGSMPPPSLVPQKSNAAKHRSAALYTYLSTALLRSLIPTLNDTKSNVERRFSLTAREREQELVEQSKKPAPPPAAKGEGEEEEEEERIYNPLKLPLGWDGKPIPYWLYKLHGLGVEYRCEICSDHVYMGRKNFERHFQESRHAFGMRALGLPNTKHFHEITRIEDALALAERLKREGRHEIFEQETMEELEDDEGNVYNRKTYEDLKKQGLI